jgi:hypothetical protein
MPKTCSFVDNLDASVTEADMAALRDTAPENLHILCNG